MCSVKNETDKVECPYNKNIESKCILRDGSSALRDSRCISCGKTTQLLMIDISMRFINLSHEVQADIIRAIVRVYSNAYVKETRNKGG